MYCPKDVVEEIRMKNNIMDIIPGYVKLTEKGGNYFGLCPFHNEKSSSLSVAPVKRIYYCFGCRVGGNIITLVMEYKNYSFSEAPQMLAGRAGVALSKEGYSKEAKVQAGVRATLSEINELTVNYSYYQLGQPQNKIGYDYPKRRELSDETIRRLGLGFTNKTSDGSYQYLKKKGYGDAILRETGLVTIEERDIHDKFQNRVIFPVTGIDNRAIGLGGRVMGDGTPKYLNPPETELFDKSRNLYGLNYIRTSREKCILICEGYMDVIVMHRTGSTNVVASLGTALTTWHAALLKHHTTQVILAYDSDNVDTRMAPRVTLTLKEVGMPIKALNMGPYKDPDEFMKNLGANAFRERIAQVKSSFIFEIGIIKKNYGIGDPKQKTAFYNEVAKKLLEFQDMLKRDNYLEAASREHFINYQGLKQLANRLGSRPDITMKRLEREEVPEREKKEKDDRNRRSQRLLLTWPIENPELSDRIEGVVLVNDFREDPYHQVVVIIFEGHAKGEVNPAGILNHFVNDEEQYKEVAVLFNASLRELLGNEEQEKAFSEIIIKVRRHSLDETNRDAEDIMGLQETIKAQSALKDLNISPDQGDNIGKLWEGERYGREGSWIWRKTGAVAARDERKKERAEKPGNSGLLQGRNTEPREAGRH